MYLMTYLGDITQSLDVIAPWDRLTTVDLFQGGSVTGKVRARWFGELNRSDLTRGTGAVTSPISRCPLARGLREHYFRIRRQALCGSRDKHGKRLTRGLAAGLDSGAASVGTGSALISVESP
ncbi:hypothetical protein DFH09DRAFT_1082272 [Mycena vulgaris]|nr:hypothetical protein DFH09DRAFT_1082272 [Mycena vulgaris]